MPVSVQERSRWELRLQKEISDRINRLQQDNAGEMLKIEQEAMKQAEAELDFCEEIATMDALADEEQEIKIKRDATLKKIATKLGRTRIASYEYSSAINLKSQTQAREYEQILLQKYEFGQEILRLRKLMETLLDELWLCTTTKQIQVVWRRVLETLGGKLGVGDVLKELVKK